MYVKHIYTTEALLSAGGQEATLALELGKKAPFQPRQVSGTPLLASGEGEGGQGLRIRAV